MTTLKRLAVLLVFALGLIYFIGTADVSEVVELPESTIQQPVESETEAPGSEVDLFELKEKIDPQPTPAEKPSVLAHQLIADQGYAMRKHVIYFSFKGCRPCEYIKPYVGSLSRRRGIKVYMFTKENHSQAVAMFGVDQYPTFILMDKGEIQSVIVSGDSYIIESELKRYGFFDNEAV